MNDDKLRLLEFKAAEPAVDTTGIALLEGLVERLRAGELAGVAVVTVHRDGSTGSAWSDGAAAQLMAVVGATQYLVHRMAESLDKTAF